MIYRFMFKGYYKDKNFAYLPNDKVNHVSLFSFEDKVFLYFESHDEYVDPQTVVKCSLKEYPNGDVWERMAKIFHYCEAVSDEQWERKIPHKQPLIRVNYIKPEKIASYIFYHHQYQEESPCDGEKYGAIFLSGNFMVFYQETPNELQEPKHAPNILPKKISDWGKLMNQHFLETPTVKSWTAGEKWENKGETL